MTPPQIVDPDTLDELLLPVLEKLEKKEFELPPLPRVAGQVLAVTNDPHADALKLTTLIQQDPILTAKIFQTSNSVTHGSKRKIESLQQAIAWLGLDTIAGTAFALSIQSGTFNVRGYEEEVQGLWTHALATGFYGKAIASQIGRNSDTAFLCGLLHAIGKPFVVHTVNQYQQNTDTPVPWSAMLVLMKETYVEVGRELSLTWDFPLPVKETINCHENFSFHLSTSPTKGAVITCLAQQLASHYLDPIRVSEEFLRSLPVVAALGLEEEDLEALFAMKQDIQKQVSTMLL